MGIQRVLPEGPGVLPHAHYQPGQIGRAAGAAEPGLPPRLDMGLPGVLPAGVGPDLQGVDVEEFLPVRRHAGEHAVIQGPLHDVGVSRLRLHLQHAAGEEHQPHGGARLRIGGIVGQVIGEGKRLPGLGAAHTAGDVHLPPRHVLPQRPACRPHGLVAGEAGAVGHAAVEIHGPDGVAHRLLLLPDGEVGLVVLVAQILRGGGSFAVLGVEVVGPLAPAVQKALGQVPVALLSRSLVEAEQGHFRDLMAGIALAPAVVPERLVNEVREAAGGAEELILARSLPVGHGPLRQVAEAVELVVVPEVGEGAVQAVQYVVGVQIAVGLLGGADQVDELVRPGLQLRIGPLGDSVGRRLHPLGEIAVLKDIAIEAVRVGAGRVRRQHFKAPGRAVRRREVLPRLRPLRGEPGRGLEIVDAVAGSRPGHLVVKGPPLIGQHRPPHQVHFRGPEGVLHPQGLQLQYLALLSG